MGFLLSVFYFVQRGHTEIFTIRKESSFLDFEGFARWQQ